MTRVPRPPVGLLPAAGRGLRFGTTPPIKELLPLDLTDEPAGPRPICEVALRSMRSAGAERCVVVIAPDKTEIARVLGTGTRVGLPLSYVVQPEPEGLPQAVSIASSALADRDVLLALPDTVMLPLDAVAAVHQHRLDTGADLCLGVFPVDEPERLGPVEIDCDGEIIAIHDKPERPCANNSWGVASWTPAFTAFCVEWERTAARGRERALGHVFEAARQSRMRIVARSFPDGALLDVGTPHGLRATRRVLSERGLLDATTESR